MKTRCLCKGKFRCDFFVDLYRKNVGSGRDLRGRKEQIPFKILCQKSYRVAVDCERT